MAAQGPWPDNMKILLEPDARRDQRLVRPAAQINTNWKLMSTKFKKLYCRTTGSYAKQYFTIKMRPSETAPHFFYKLNAAVVKAEIPFQTSSKRFVKKLKTALEDHQFQCISQVERVPRRHQDVWIEDGYEAPPMKTRDVSPTTYPVESMLGPALSRKKHFQFQTPYVEEQPLAATPVALEYGQEGYDHQISEMTDESYEAYHVSECSEQQRLDNRSIFCDKCKKWGHPDVNCWQDIVCGNCAEMGHPARVCRKKRCSDCGEVNPGIPCAEWRAFKTVKHLTRQGMLDDAVPSQTLAQLQTNDIG
ncbi:LOW QUALITY PROTEIN: hypothetical protein PHMEG_00016368 [Phytophthora megakarya]|uniref:CCHC-type domain-containing protein n=1 Tax=Phytophthora megakarya TaxID=4795 RepID=A0A225VZ70_9STRA|nr:LOW QUALITY PROTEIN: hypothetical protein PHMEG_00016368 [Phytophthora megakarya]